MRCDAVLSLLSDFADRSLSPVSALRVRRHLQTCAACQTAWADAQTFNQKARALYADKIVLPPDLRTRVLSAAPAPVARPVRPRARRRYSWAEVAGICVCLLVCLISVALLNRISKIPARPSVAFAQVEAAMQNVQTVHWIETNRSSTNFGDGAPLGPPRTSEKWARLEPFDLATISHSAPTPNKPYIVKNDFHMVMNGQRQIVYTSFNNTYRTTSFIRREKEDMNGDGVKGSIISQIISPDEVSNYIRTRPKDGAVKSPSEKLPMWLPKPSAWKSRAVTEAGRSLILFERTQPPWKLPARYGNKGRAFGKVTFQTWVEPDTHRVVRFEQKQYALNGRDVHYQTIADQFRYNENLPPSTFILVPPPGAKVKREEERVVNPVWETLPASEKQKIQAAINASDKGWRDGNFAAFASAWDFGYLHARIPSLDTGTVRRQQWAFRVSHQKNNWAEWRSVIVGAEKQNFVAGESFAPNSPDVLRVDVTVTGKPKRKNGREWSSSATFYLNRTKTGAYSVVEWEWNSLWMKTALPSLRAR